MPRQHPGAPADVACIWPGSSDITDEMAQRLICWASEENINTSSDPIFHFETLKSNCTTYGPLKFTAAGADNCPLGDDLTVTVADPIDPNTCAPPPGSAVTSVNGQTGVVVLDAADVGAADDTLVVHKAGVETITGEKTFTNVVNVDQPDAATSGLIITQANAVTSSDANMGEMWYLGFNTRRDTEIGMLRVITPPASTGLGKEGEATAQFHAGTSTSKALRILDHTGAENAFILGNGSATFDGPILGSNNLESAWTAITIDSPQTAGKYTANPDGTNDANSPQVRIINGGKTAELRGRINVLTVGGVTDEIIATTMPTSIALGSGTVSSVPPLDRGFMVFGSGGGLRVIVNSTGAMQLIGSALTQPYMMLDGCTYSLES